MKSVVIFVIGLLVGGAFARVVVFVEEKEHQAQCKDIYEALDKYKFTIEEKTGYRYGMAEGIYFLSEENDKRIPEIALSEKVLQAAKEKYDATIRQQMYTISTACGCCGSKEADPECKQE